MLWPAFDEEELRRHVFDVCWQRYGGSGLNITWSEAWDLDWGELLELHDLIQERLQQESNAIRAASRKK